MNYQTINDAVLLSWMKGGDEAAFQEIYKRYWKKLYLIARSKLQPEESPEDLIQDLFIKLWENRQVLEIENLSAYLSTSLRYAVINLYKSRLTKEKYLVHQQYTTGSDTGTEEEIACNELMLSLNRQVQVLPEKTRTIFHLNRFEYKTVKEIAQQLGIPERTIEYHIHQAQKLLKAALQEYLPFTYLIIPFQYFIELFKY